MGGDCERRLEGGRREAKGVLVLAQLGGADEATTAHPVGLLADPLHDSGGDHVPAEAEASSRHIPSEARCARGRQRARTQVSTASTAIWT